MKNSDTYKLCANLLSIRHEGNATELTNLPCSEEDWQQFVQVGNRHLILPSLYLALKSNTKIEQYNPELIQTLSYIYYLNKKRNLRIIEQAKEINDLLKSNNIEPIFLKGVANLLDNLYLDIGDRIIYDIDVLVPPEQFIKAFEVLKEANYFSETPINTKALASIKHAPPQCKEGMPSFVEIHKSAMGYQYEKLLTYTEISKNSTIILYDNLEFRIMNLQHRIIHNFIHSQLQHRGYKLGNVSLRDAYDLYLLYNKTNQIDYFKNMQKHKVKAYGYLLFMHQLFNQTTPSYLNNNKYDKQNTRYLKKLDKAVPTTFLSNYLIPRLEKYTIQPFTMLWDKGSINYIYSRLIDPTWYKRKWCRIQDLLSGRE